MWVSALCCNWSIPYISGNKTPLNWVELSIEIIKFVLTKTNSLTYLFIPVTSIIAIGKRQVEMCYRLLKVHPSAKLCESGSMYPKMAEYAMMHGHQRGQYMLRSYEWFLDVPIVPTSAGFRNISRYCNGKISLADPKLCPQCAPHFWTMHSNASSHWLSPYSEGSLIIKTTVSLRLNWRAC